MHVDMADYIQYCLVCQWDKPPMLPKKKLHRMDKGSAPFFSWSIDMMGPFPWAKDRNCYLLITDPFFK